MNENILNECVRECLSDSQTNWDIDKTDEAYYRSAYADGVLDLARYIILKMEKIMVFMVSIIRPRLLKELGKHLLKTLN